MAENPRPSGGGQGRQERTPRLISGLEFVTSFAQQVECGSGEVFLNQHIIRVVGRDGEMGMSFVESGSMNESRTPVCENGNGPSSFRQIQWCEE